jgi:hypothetical protein
VRNYPGGYTSYGSSHRLQGISPTFKALQRKLQGHVKSFATPSSGISRTAHYR